ncbi:hypothetical protein MASR2M70_17850 [Bacillota bacterium]
MKFDIFLCHELQTRVKGFIENVVSNAKHGFAKHRIFMDIDTFNAGCIAWLKGAGKQEYTWNNKEDAGRICSRKYLIPVSEYNFAVAADDSISYQIKKDNLVLYKEIAIVFPRDLCGRKKVFMVVSDNVVAITRIH